ncbi:helix-turn-helix transcriptional regulator [uncultured Tyzzerella sp.]|uniref:helix-turn-helix domain-containing protein n=1 Tax=uncultured Tyzzerella sp. TaxID=2321398 RepID=UPI002942740B|nr:helix-turn-helix transcriptional regulator [uncultured Tyzzerella sp.]
MNYLKYKENKIRGTFNFPIEFYFITPDDIRYNMHYHWHTEIEIIKIIEGTFKIMLNEQMVSAQKDDFIFISPEMLHGGTPKNCIYECIVLDMNMFIKNNNICTNYLKDILNKKISIHYDIHKNNDINTYLNKIFDCMRNKPLGYEFLIQGYLYLIFGIIIGNKLYVKNINTLDKNAKRINQLKNVLEFIELEYSRDITLEDLANKINLNPKYFTKIFSEMTGKSPIQYLNSYRIEIACGMLLTTDLSITDICLNCGFNDLSYFIKTFKKEKSISPKKFRNTMSMP